MNAVDIRRMKIEDAGEIGAISAAITQKTADVDFIQSVYIEFSLVRIMNSTDERFKAFLN